MQLQSTDFELFDLPVRFDQDLAAIDQRWKALQREAHPDRFAREGAAAQRMAMQWSVRINQAYRRLQDPIRRAGYLCGLNGHEIGAEDNTAMPAAFLMQQMEWREALEEADSPERLRAVEQMARASHDRYLVMLSESIDRDHNYGAAVAHIRALMFIDRLIEDIDRRTDLT